MVSKRISVPLGGAVAVLAVTALLMTPMPGATAGTAPAPSATGSSEPQPMYVFRVPVHTQQDTQGLIQRGFDVLEARDGNDLFVLGDAAAQRQLADAGFTAVVDTVMPPPAWTPPSKQDSRVKPLAGETETYYGGYHTVNAQYAHLDRIAAQYANLSTLVTYGQSWRKLQGMANGYDLRAICITKKQAGDCQQRTDSAKPKFFLMSQIHAREITTGDIAWQWIEYLVTGYGTDPTVTSLLDSTEIWVVPIANPDGVDIVQTGGSSPKLQRKNANYTNGSGCGLTGYSQDGVDLNRNADSHWNTAGTSPDPCAQTFPGPVGDSEVENSSLQQLFRSLYPAVRGPADTDPAPVSTRGVMITLHSYSNMVLFPWGFDSFVQTGNDASLRTMAANMATGMGYRYGQPGEILYNASGSTDDWIYDKLGVASFTIEIGPQSGQCSGFLPVYSCQDSLFWPQLRPTLVYAAQQAAAPYLN